MRNNDAPSATFKSKQGACFTKNVIFPETSLDVELKDLNVSSHVP